jgi:hypothetical protein
MQQTPPPSMGEFCKREDVLLVAPDLAEVARWYNEIDSSWISAERAFGIMRGMESLLRAFLGMRTFKTELLLRFKPWIMDEEIAMRCTHTRTAGISAVGDVCSDNEDAVEHGSSYEPESLDSESAMQSDDSED